MPKSIFLPNFWRKTANFKSEKIHVKCWLKIVCAACGIVNIAQSHITCNGDYILKVQLNSDKYDVFYDLTI